MTNGLLYMREGLEILRVDEGANDLVIRSLIDAIPHYLEQTTGRDWIEEDHSNIDPLAKTTASFILELWYRPHGKGTEQLKRTIDTLLTALTVKGRSLDGEGLR